MSDFDSLRRSQSPPPTPYSGSPACAANTLCESYPPNKPSRISTAILVPPTAPNTPDKPTPPVERAEPRFGNFDTPTPVSIVAQSEVYDLTVASIMELHPDEWFSSCQAAVYQEQLQSQSGARILQEKLVHAFEDASRAQFLRAQNLRNHQFLGPDTHTFDLFKTWTLAKILYLQPEMSTQLKMEVVNKSYNPGYTKVCEWIDFVAQDAEGMLQDIAIHCDQVDKYGLGDGVTMRDTLEAMDYYFENYHEDLCRIYPEYKTVPKFVIREQVTSARGRPIRDRRPRQLS